MTAGQRPACNRGARTAASMSNTSNKGIRVDIEAQDAWRWLHGDPTRLRQALPNYAGNAVKFSEHGRIVNRAELLQQDGQRLRLRFSVQDNGIGIAPDVLPRLFQAFEQADASTTRRFNGTGLGLAISRRLAPLMARRAGGRQPARRRQHLLVQRRAASRPGQRAQCAVAQPAPGQPVNRRNAVTATPCRCPCLAGRGQRGQPGGGYRLAEIGRDGGGTGD